MGTLFESMQTVNILLPTHSMTCVNDLNEYRNHGNHCIQTFWVFILFFNKFAIFLHVVSQNWRWHWMPYV